MARTTGYTATAALRMLIEGLYNEPGIVPPELIGKHPEPFDFIIRCLRDRQVVCEEEVSGGSPVLC
jgi:saccharopine dehydrogenase-like NADP-dependent oxidoreductase